jgi:hypothetical protein
MLANIIKRLPLTKGRRFNSTRADATDINKGIYAKFALAAALGGGSLLIGTVHGLVRFQVQQS